MIALEIMIVERFWTRYPTSTGSSGSGLARPVSQPVYSSLGVGVSCAGRMGTKTANDIRNAGPRQWSEDGFQPGRVGQPGAHIPPAGEVDLVWDVCNGHPCPSRFFD